MIIHSPEKKSSFLEELLILLKFLKWFQVGVTWRVIKYLLLASFWIEFENILTAFNSISTKLHYFYMNRYWLLKIAKRADGSYPGEPWKRLNHWATPTEKDLRLCQNRQVQSFWFSGHFCRGERSISCIMGGWLGLNDQRHQKGTCALLKDRF